MRPGAAGASKPSLFSRRRSLSTFMRERPPSDGLFCWLSASRQGAWYGRPPPHSCQLTPRRDQIHRRVISRAQSTAIDLQHARSRPASRSRERGAMPGVVSPLSCANSGDEPHVRAYPMLRTSACGRTTAIRGVAGFVRPLRGSVLIKMLRTGLVDQLPCVIFEGVPAQPAAAAHIARTDARPTAAEDTDWATRVTSAPRIRRDLRFGKVQPSSPSARRAAASRSSRHAAWHAA